MTVKKDETPFEVEPVTEQELEEFANTQTNPEEPCEEKLLEQMLEAYGYDKLFADTLTRIEKSVRTTRSMMVTGVTGVAFWLAVISAQMYTAEPVEQVVDHPVLATNLSNADMYYIGINLDDAAAMMITEDLAAPGQMEYYAGSLYGFVPVEEAEPYMPYIAAGSLYIVSPKGKNLLNIVCATSAPECILPILNRTGE